MVIDNARKDGRTGMLRCHYLSLAEMFCGGLAFCGYSCNAPVTPRFKKFWAPNGVLSDRSNQESFARIQRRITIEGVSALWQSGSHAPSHAKTEIGGICSYEVSGLSATLVLVIPVSEPNSS